MNPVENSSIYQRSEALSVSVSTELTAPMTIPHQTYTLGQWLEEWLEVYKKGTVKQVTAKRYVQIITMICSSYISQKELKLIDERDMVHLLTELQGRTHHRKVPYSKSTLKKVKETLSQAFRKAKQIKMVDQIPWSDVATPAAPQKTVLPLSHWQQEMLERACEEDPQGHLIIFLLRTGLRRSELINLTWSDYDASKGTILIRASKTPAGIRTVYLVQEAKAIIEQQIPRGEAIFFNMRGTPISESSLRRLCERLRRATHIHTFTCHVCRHTFVTRLCEKGVSAKAIAQIIGHAHTGYVLDIYAMLERKELRKAIYALEQGNTTSKAPEISEDILTKHFKHTELVLLKQYSVCLGISVWDAIRLATMDWLCHHKQCG